jgi:diacylglycerol kinase family enzyme
MVNQRDIVLLCNPIAGGRWKELASILDSDQARFVRRVVTDSIDDIVPAIVALSHRTKLLCVYGGDGTIQRVLDALHASSRIGEPPQLAFIGGGTMNVGARWCGLTHSPTHNFRSIVSAYRRGELAMREVPLLRVNDGEGIHHGLTFAMGPLVRILAAYEDGRKGKVAAVAAGLRGLAAAWSGRPKDWRPIVAEMAATVTLDDERLPFERYVAVVCSVMSTINPTVEPFARARSPETFHCLAYAVSPREFLWAMPLLWRGYLPVAARSLLRPASTFKQLGLSYFGKGVVPSDPRYVNCTAKRLFVEATDEVYTVDGEIHPLKGHTVEVSLGPLVRLAVAPAGGLGPVLRLAVYMRRFIPGRTRAE